MRNQSGFTMIELMVTLLIAVILTTIAIPSFRSMILDNRIVTASNRFLADANLARSEAIKRGTSVEIAPNSTTSGWTGGWKVRLPSGGTVIKVADPLTDNVTITGATAAITFGSNGAASAQETLSVCDSNRNGEHGKQIDIALSGRVGTSDTTCP